MIEDSAFGAITERLWRYLRAESMMAIGKGLNAG
jgi:hypothetical protein